MITTARIIIRDESRYEHKKIMKMVMIKNMIMVSPLKGGRVPTCSAGLITIPILPRSHQPRDVVFNHFGVDHNMNL